MIHFITAVKKVGIKLTVILFWLLIWHLVSIRIGQQILLVSPVSAIRRLLYLAGKVDFWKSILFTIERIGSGFLIAVGVGLLLAILASQIWLLEVLLHPLLQAFKSVPVASFIILCLVWVSAKNLSVFVSFIMALPIIYTNILAGIRALDQGLIEMADVFRIPLAKRIIYIYLSQIMPYFKAACTISLGMCWKAGIAAEVIGTPRGSLGEKLYLAKVNLNMADLFAWTIVIIIISIVFEQLITAGLEFILSQMERM